MAFLLQIIGGNTLFANMYKAYEDLEESMKQKIKKLKVCVDQTYNKFV